MPPKDRTSFAARFEYLAAIEKEWPAVLRDLQQDALPVFQTHWESNVNRPAVQVSRARQKESSPGLDLIDQAVRRWADKYGFQDPWLWDAAIQTLHAWAQGRSVGRWNYFPQELDALRFEPQLGYWIPEFSSWAEFKKLTNAAYRQQLADYRAKVREVWGEGQTREPTRSVDSPLAAGKEPRDCSASTFKEHRRSCILIRYSSRRGWIRSVSRHNSPKTQGRPGRTKNVSREVQAITYI
jgi:hypothetical protein